MRCTRVHSEVHSEVHKVHSEVQCKVHKVHSEVHSEVHSGGAHRMVMRSNYMIICCLKASAFWWCGIVAIKVCGVIGIHIDRRQPILRDINKV